MGKDGANGWMFEGHTELRGTKNTEQAATRRWLGKAWWATTLVMMMESGNPNRGSNIKQ